MDKNNPLNNPLAITKRDGKYMPPITVRIVIYKNNVYESMKDFCVEMGFGDSAFRDFCESRKEIMNFEDIVAEYKAYLENKQQTIWGNVYKNLYTACESYGVSYA